ncbi:MAG: hypothetical protein ACJ8FY_16235 [Gemmataceae bacterium]
MIVLSKTGFLDLIQIMGDPVLIPTAVVHEIQQAGPNDPAVRALSQTRWIRIVDPGVAPRSLRPFGLDAGEEAVLTWALANPGAKPCSMIKRPGAARKPWQFPTEGVWDS